MPLEAETAASRTVRLIKPCDTGTATPHFSSQLTPCSPWPRQFYIQEISIVHAGKQGIAMMPELNAFFFFHIIYQCLTGNSEMNIKNYKHWEK